MSSFAPVIGILAIFLIANLNFERITANRPRLLPVAVLVLSFLLTASSLHVFFKAAKLKDQSVTEGLIKVLESKIDAHATAPRNVLVFDGGSYTAYGLDGDRLAAQLNAKGYPSLVLQVSMGAADHFERNYVHQAIFPRLQGLQRKAGEKCNYLLLLEPCLVYDHNPLGFFNSSGITDRYLTYLNLRVAFDSLKLLLAIPWQRSIPVPDKSIMTRKFFGNIVSCALINFFNIGRIDRLTTMARLTTQPCYTPQERADPKFKFAGVQYAMEVMKSPKLAELPPWLDQLWMQPLLNLYRGLCDKVVIFTPPLLWDGAISHAASVRNKYSAMPSIYPNDSIYRRLDHKEYWIDPTHMRKEGVKLYTDWLAEQLVAGGFLVR